LRSNKYKRDVVVVDDDDDDDDDDDEACPDVMINVVKT
jgi:glycerol-3-phosphate cytidylyltransferase-like family protein